MDDTSGERRSMDPWLVDIQLFIRSVSKLVPLRRSPLEIKR